MTENLKDALVYAVGLSKNEKVIYEQNGKTYYDTNRSSLLELEPIKRAETLTVSTLSSLVSFLIDHFAYNPDNPKLMIHVESPTSVKVLSELDADRKRESLIQAKTTTDSFPYRRFLDSEQFIINMQSLIQREDDAEAILKCASSLRIEGGADLTDNGVSQVASVKVGAATVEKGKVPSPAGLRPYRTFLDIEQPKSPFIFRVNKDGDCALFEADGGIWKNIATGDIKEYLDAALADLIEAKKITVIA